MHREHRSARGVTVEQPGRVRTLRSQCGLCWGQGAIWEQSLLGLLPVVCEGCGGTGRDMSPGSI